MTADRKSDAPPVELRSVQHRLHIQQRRRPAQLIVGVLLVASAVVMAARHEYLSAAISGGFGATVLAVSMAATRYWTARARTTEESPPPKVAHQSVPSDIGELSRQFLAADQEGPANLVRDDPSD